MTDALRLRALLFVVLASGGGPALAQESGKEVVETAAPDQAVCADPWYGGCPDSCTQSFRRLQNRGALTERALETWADQCVKTEEQSQQQQQQSQQQQQDQDQQQQQQTQTAQSDRQSGAAETQETESQEQAQAQTQEQNQATSQAAQQAQQQSQPQQQAQSEARSQQQQQQQQAGAQTAPSQSQAQQSRDQAQSQQTAQAAGAQQQAGETGSRPPGNAAGAPSAQSPASQRGGGQADPDAGGRETAAETPAAAGREDASEDDSASLPQLAESRRGAAQGESLGQRGGRGGGESPETAQQAARAGEDNDESGGGRNTGSSLMTPLPRGQGSTGRPFEPLERALDELGGRGFGLSERAGMACGLAAAPMCGGLCQAGVCAPSAEGGGCRCRPAQTPETAKHRRRALCTLTGPSRLTVSVCRSPGSGASASCAVAGSAESGLCETLWSVPYGEVAVLDGGRNDLDLRLDAVPLWNWGRPDEAIDRVSVPLGGSGKSVDPKSVWESAEEPLPASDVRLLIGSKSTGEVAVLQNVAGGRLRETKTTLRTAQLVSGCDDSGDACPETQLARLRLTLFAQAPDTRLLATFARQGAEWWGECAAGTIEERAEVLCYQLRTDGSNEARAWEPLRLDWLGESASVDYAAALMEPEEEERSALERAFFARAAATQGSAPALLLAFASQEAERAYAQGGLPRAGGAAEGDLAGLLVLESDELTRLTPAGRSALARRSRDEIVRAVGEAGQGGDGAGARLAAAAILDPGMIALTRRRQVGACLMRSRPRPALACLHETEEASTAAEPAVWDPLAWPGRGPQPRHDREALLAAARAAGARSGALGDPVLDLVLSAAVAPEGRNLRAFDIYRSPESGSADAGASWQGLILAFKRRDGETAPLFAQCSEEALFLSERRRTPLAGTLRLLNEGAGGAGCTAAFPDTYGTHREEIRRRLAERLPAGIESLALNSSRALLKTRSPAGASLIEVWVAAPGMDRDFPTVTAQCLMRRAEQAADLAPEGERPGQLGLEHALLTPDWRELGWRANPLGLMLRAESCEEGV